MYRRVKYTGHTFTHDRFLRDFHQCQCRFSLVFRERPARSIDNNPTVVTDTADSDRSGFPSLIALCPNSFTGISHHSLGEHVLLFLKKHKYFLLVLFFIYLFFFEGQKDTHLQTNYPATSRRQLLGDAFLSLIRGEEEDSCRLYKKIPNYSSDHGR